MSSCQHALTQFFLPLANLSSQRRLTVSLAESLMFRGAIKPITFGGKLYLTYKLVMWGRERAVEMSTQARSGPACLSLLLPGPGGMDVR